MCGRIGVGENRDAPGLAGRRGGGEGGGLQERASRQHDQVLQKVDPAAGW